MKKLIFASTLLLSFATVGMAQDLKFDVYFKVIKVNYNYSGSCSCNISATIHYANGEKSSVVSLFKCWIKSA
jgi:hypothetical protein